MSKSLVNIKRYLLTCNGKAYTFFFYCIDFKTLIMFFTNIAHNEEILRTKLINPRK